MSKLKKSEFNNFVSRYEDLKVEAQKISNRLHECLAIVFRDYGETLSIFYVGDAELTDDTVVLALATAGKDGLVSGYYCGSKDQNDGPKMVLYKGKEIDLAWDFPIDWLQKDFRKEFRKCKKEFEDQVTSKDLSNLSNRVLSYL